MDVIGDILSSVCNALYDAFIEPLFNALKPLFISAIIIIGIVIAIYVGKAIYHSNKEKRDEDKYISAMQEKYANRSKSELVEIYDLLTRLENCRNLALKKKADLQSKDEEKRWMVSACAWEILDTELRKRYPFIVDKYLHHDIAYLKN